MAVSWLESNGVTECDGTVSKSFITCSMSVAVANRFNIVMMTTGDDLL